MVDYHRALLWAVKDYKEAHLDSWIIQYPLSVSTFPNLFPIRNTVQVLGRIMEQWLRLCAIESLHNTVFYP